tara:strand:- start:3192 stop:3854 length:663 start_codon:yes stop_codon:yes gene_type:complete
VSHREIATDGYSVYNFSAAIKKNPLNLFGTFFARRSEINDLLTYLHESAMVSNPYSDAILSSTLLHYEKIGLLNRCRSTLSRLRKFDEITKIWRTMMCGAQIELRAGNFPVARELLRFLRRHVGWFGPLHVLSAGMESRYLGNYKEALRILRRGATSVPRYGPIAINSIRVAERVDIESCDYDIITSRAIISEVLSTVCKELLWKALFEAAGVEVSKRSD